MGETDRPLVFRDEFFGEGGRAGTGFDGGVDVVAVGCDDTKDCVLIVGNGRIGKDFALLIHDADLDFLFA